MKKQTKRAMAGERPCANANNHTPIPGGGPLTTGYGAFMDFANKMSKTHAQVRCPSCGLWKIWLPKAEAKIINAQDRKDAREVLEWTRKNYGKRRRKNPTP